MSTLPAYRLYLRRHPQPFPCSFCDQPVLPQHFESHCSSNHAFNPRLKCVWCAGGMSWPSKQKQKHLNHIIPCMRRFLRVAFTPPAVESSELQQTPVAHSFDHTSIDLKRSLFHHLFNPPPRAYDSFYLLSLDPIPLLFETDALNLAVACLRTYLRLRDTTEWFHVMVRAVGYTDFVQALDPAHMHTLPFSCWCDGGKPKEASHRQHRHFIVVCDPPGHFATWVKTIQFKNRPRQYFKCLYSKPIESPMHFVNTLGYLCKRTSRCKFSGERNKKTPEEDNHFYLFEELPKGYRLPLVVQWPEGLDLLLHQEHRHFKRPDLVHAPLFYDGRWRIKIQDIPGVVLGTVLPVARDYEPCDAQTEAFVHLLGGRKLFFKRNPKLLRAEPEAWLQTQAEKGNAFYHAVGNDTWTPRPLHQGLVHDFKPLVDENRDLKARLDQQQQAIEALVERQRELEARYQTACEALEEERKRAREGLEKEVERWRRKSEAAEEENRRLRDEHARLKDEEVERMAKELADVKKEVQRLRSSRTILF